MKGFYNRLILFAFRSLQLSLGKRISIKQKIMTNEFHFEERWLSPFFRIRNPHVTCAEQWIPPGPWQVSPSEERVADSNQPIDFQFHWTAEGPLNAIIPNPNNMRWECRAMVEGMGTGIETQATLAMTPFVGAVPSNTYVATIAIPPPAGGWPTGVYEVVATLQLVQVDNTGAIINRFPVVGFAELGKMQIFASP